MIKSIYFLLLAFVLPGFILGFIIGETITYHLHYDSVQYQVEQICKGPDCAEYINKVTEYQKVTEDAQVKQQQAETENIRAQSEKRNLESKIASLEYKLENMNTTQVMINGTG